MKSPPAPRIIFVPFIDGFGGVERLALELSRFLHQANVRHTIACFRQTIDLSAYAHWPLRVEEILVRRNSLLEARALREFLKAACPAEDDLPLLFDLKSAFYSGIVNIGPFCLHLTDPPSLLGADLSKYSFSARRCERFANSPRLGLPRTARAELVHRLNRRGVSRAARVLVMTERIRGEMQELYEVDPEVIRPGVAAAFGFRPGSNQDSQDTQLRMLSVSRLESNKRIDWILRALAELIATQKLSKADWLFEIVGQGPDAGALQKLSVDLNLADRIRFLGHVSDDALAEAYARANLFVMPAVQGYGLPALEALQRGIPTIVHRDSGVSEILTGTPWAELVAGDNGSLAGAIAHMKDRLDSKTLSASNAPRLPTNSEWARAIFSACKWAVPAMN